MTKKTNSKPKQLKLDTKNKKIAGVSAGIAQYFDSDPAIVRMAAVILVILTGLIPGLIIYVVFYLLMKNNSGGKAKT